MQQHWHPEHLSYLGACLSRRQPGVTVEILENAHMWALGAESGHFLELHACESWQNEHLQSHRGLLWKLHASMRGDR
jgi:hypothetical protein